MSDLKEWHTWQAKPDKPGYYLLRSGDASAWSSYTQVQVQRRQEFRSLGVLMLDENLQPCVLMCVDDFSEYNDWMFMGEEASSLVIPDEELDRVTDLPKVNKRPWPERAGV